MRCWTLPPWLEFAPTLKAERFSQAVRYFEFLTDDARLVAANVRDAHAAGAVTVSYAEVTELIVEGGRTTGLRARSTLPGEAREAVVRAALVINAAGPWVDAVRGLDTAERDPRMALSRGIHLVFDRARLPAQATLILPTSDRRSIFVVPRGRFSYLGTTDTFQDDLGYWPAPRRADIDYLFREARAALNLGQLGDDDIVSIWSACAPWWPRPTRAPARSPARTRSGPRPPASSPSPAASSAPIAPWPSAWSTLRSRPSG